MKIRHTIMTKKEDYNRAMRLVDRYADGMIEIFSTQFYNEITFTCGIVNWMKFKRLAKYHNLETEFC